MFLTERVLINKSVGSIEKYVILQPNSCPKMTTTSEQRHITKQALWPLYTLSCPVQSVLLGVQNLNVLHVVFKHGWAGIQMYTKDVTQLLIIWCSVPSLRLHGALSCSMQPHGASQQPRGNLPDRAIAKVYAPTTEGESVGQGYCKGACTTVLMHMLVIIFFRSELHYSSTPSSVTLWHIMEDLEFFSLDILDLLVISHYCGFIKALSVT